MSANRFLVTYRIRLYHDEDINSKIENICREQSVELPRSVLTHLIERDIVGSLVRLQRNEDATYNADIAYPTANVGHEITQFLNVLFGNISLVPGIQVQNVAWESLPEDLLPGPRFGISGIRALLGIPKRALSATALKPMGSTSVKLVEFAYEFAMGGIDIIKDDHGLADQSYAPFTERLKACTQAVKQANEQTGRTSWYVPHITAHGEDLLRRFDLAREYGAGAVMICPQLCSPDALSTLARQNESMPIIAHPAFSGVYVQDKHHGFDKAFFYGALWRAMGADFSIFPNHAGRFSFTLDECLRIVHTSKDTSLPFKTTFPVPGGGLQRDSLPKWINHYGADIVFLIGGSLYQHPKGIQTAAKEIHSLLEEFDYGQ